MCRRNLAAAWLGVILLSGMFLMGQESWPPAPDNRPAVDTGMDLCYNASIQVTCPAVGQPFYGQDAQYSTNPMNLVAGTDTVTDNVTRLEWQREDDNTTRTWANAATYCDTLVLDTKSDWRLPNDFELQSIANLQNYYPAVDTTVFPGITTARYWTATENAASPGNVWTLNFTAGTLTSSSATASYLVMCVRGKETIYSLTDNGDGTVTDAAAKLVWQQEDDDTVRTWEQALAYCEASTLAGKTDWRLPNAKELRSIVDPNTSNPAIDAAVFPNTDSALYWTSTTTVNSRSRAWCMDFSSAASGDNAKTSATAYTRCVRKQ